jgi:protein ImuB
VKVEHGAPVEIVARRGMPGGRIINRAGPWRTSGHWWTEAGRWSRDEWDLELPTGVVRLSLDRRTGRWEIEGVFD